MVDLTHARIDRAHALAPGLFRSLGPGDRKRMKLDVTYDYGNGDQLEFQGFEPLGVLDMRVLQGLVAMAGPDGTVLQNSQTASESGQMLLALLYDPADDEIRRATVKPMSLVVNDSLRRLAREIGAGEDGRSIGRIRKCVERLFGVTIFVQSGGKRIGSRLLSVYASDEDTGGLRVAFNPRLAAAVIGGAHARIDMTEVRALESDPARIIHQRLSAFIDPGRSRELLAETLSAYVWPDPADTPRTARSRLTKVRKATEELKELPGWTVEKIRSDKWRFTRPRIGRESS